MNDPVAAFAANAREPLPPAFVQALSSRFAERFSIAMAVREQHGRDESFYPVTPPDAVVYATSTDEVVQIVKLCDAHNVPIIPYGAGSSLEGHLLAVRGGISIDLSRMNAVLAINAEDQTATVQAGVTRKQLNAALNGTGLFFPIDPGADASIGGMSATRASGTNAVRYGTMRENVLGLTVVTPEGRVVKTGTRAKKSSAGYDLTRLFVGSEGTLGVMTEITVRLYPQPEAVMAAVVNFPTLHDAVQTVIETIQVGIPIARVELVDEALIRAINNYSKTTLREAMTLFFEFQGTERGVKEQVETVQAIAAEHGAADFEWAERPEDRTRLWTARHNAYFAGLQVKPGCRALSTDTCVPISKLAASIEGARKILDESKLPSLMLGHVGDGNFHVMLLVDPDKPDDVAEAEALNDRIVDLAISMDGTCTGEHGIGLHKKGFLLQEAGDEAVALMRQIKRALDPKGLMNPGKVFDI